MQEDQIYTYLEDFKVGQKFVAGPISVTAEEIIKYAKEFDPQDFHTNAEKAKDTAFGELVASGWHTTSLTMRMINQALPKFKGGMIGRQVKQISWPRPVRPNDTLSLEVEVLYVRPTQSNPTRGIMVSKNTTKNQDGKIVLEMEATIFVPRKKKA